ncbi:MAG TPA: SDR family oxidoreductase [Gammaproteobacteria bacterium]
MKNSSRLRLKKLSDQVMVITGASSGIGLVTARMAAARGARLVLAARNEEALKKLCGELGEIGGEAVHVVADVGQEGDVRRIERTAIERFGGFDTWFNNAGVSIYGRLLDLSLGDQRRLFDTNFWGVVHGSRIAAEHLMTAGGAIINMGSTLSDRAIPLQGIYSASKHAVKGYTDALRMELEEAGAPVSVTLIKPGTIDTPYTRHAKNYLDVEPTNPPPYYAPDVVADAVLHCAEHPTRDVFVGVGGAAISAGGRYAPYVTDRIMQNTLFRLQRTNSPANAIRADNLHAPAGDFEERGGYPGHVAESSLYTKASLHPRTAGALVLATGLAAGALWRNARR